MLRLATALLTASLLWAPAEGQAGPGAAAQAPVTTANALQTLTIPAGAKVELVLIRPVWTKTAKPGDLLYAQTTFPVIVGNRIAIPPGSYVEGLVKKLTPPTRRSNRAEFQVLFTEIVLADGYVVPLPGSAIDASDPAGAMNPLIAISVQVSIANDLLLDNGAQIELTPGAPLAVNAARIAQAVPLSRAPIPGAFRSATLCRPTSGFPGTPGTPDTVIPGSPGTPPTVIPGSPGTPDISGTVCPGSPVVLSCAPVTAPGAQSPNPLPATAH